MPATDPEELAQRLDREVEDMQRHTDRLGHEVAETREDWEHKRSDPSVPGAPPKEDLQDDEQPSSPDPQAPPPEEGPSASQEASELEVGPPADPGTD
jgi:hypothetical protein